MNGFETKPCTRSEARAWAAFLDRNFGYAAPLSYATDFAPIFEEDALKRSRLIWKDGKIVASATLYPVTAVTFGKPMTLAIIGAVATEESFRGQGLSAHIMKELEDFARAFKVEALVLWSDQKDFYGKLGFSAMGQQQIFTLENLPAPLTLAKGTPTYGWDWNQVRSIYEKHPMRTRRNDSYWKSLGSIKSCTRVEWTGTDGVVQAYLGFDRGKDLNGIIHEWGGEKEALHSLLWTVLQNRANLVWLTHPKLQDPIRDLLASPQPLLTGELALFKPLSASLTVKDFESVWFWGLDSL